MKKKEKSPSPSDLEGRYNIKEEKKESPPPPPPPKRAAPPFPPPPPSKEKEDSGRFSDEEELEAERQEIAKDEFIIEVVKDICDAGFEVWALWEHDPEIELNEKEKDRLSRPLTRIAVKYGGAKYLKDEFLFGISLAAIIIKRLSRKKKTSEAKDVSDGRGQERIREDDAGKKPNPQQ